MSDWSEATDPSSGKKYYYNRTTKVTQWDKPAELAGPPAPAPVSSADPENIAANWRIAKDPSSGKEYYYNNVTKKTSWSKPACMESPTTTTTASPTVVAQSQPSAASAPSPDANLWREVKDPSSGRSYWYHTQTKATTWTNPHGGSVGGYGVSNGAQLADQAKVQEALAAEKDWVDEDVAKEKEQQEKEAKEEAERHAAERAAAEAEEKAKRDKEKADREREKAERMKRTTKRNDSDDEGHGNDDAEDSAPAEEDKQAEAALDIAMNKKLALANKSLAEIRNQKEDTKDNSELKLEIAKHRHGLLRRLFRVGDGFDEKKLFSWKKSQIKKSVLKANREFDSDSVQCFKNLMSYMGDRSSSKGPTEHAKKMLRNMMQAVPSMRDELFVQIIKQTTNNPKLESTIKGWEMMNYCCASFPPSKNVRAFLIDYFEKVIKTDIITPKVAEMAKMCMQRLEKITHLGMRKFVPSTQELDCVKDGKPVPIKIALVNGQSRTFQCDSYMLVQDVLDMLCQSFNLTVTSPFGLYEMETIGVEHLLDNKDRILDVLASWENVPLEELSSKDDKNKKYAVKKETKKKKEEPKWCAFLFKPKLMIKTSSDTLMTDMEAVHLTYTQAVSDVVTGRYPSTDKDVTVLAALQLQATFGDYNGSLHQPGFLAPKLKDFLPLVYFQKKGKTDTKLEKDYEANILGKWQKVKGFTIQEAKLNYLDYVQEWPFYGSTFWTVEQRQFKDYPSPLTLGINSEGVLLMHPDKRNVLEVYSFTDIVTWGHADEKFIVVVGNIVQQRKLIFKTTAGKAMNQLIHDYVNFKVKGTTKV